MDVKYIPADWDKMRTGLSDLLGRGWGKGMFDYLKDVNEVLEDAEQDIAKYDVDGAISFHHKSQKSIYNSLSEDFSVLYRFTGKVGDIVDRTIDEPFYKDMDAFVQSVRDLSISNYSTDNRIGATETVYYGYGAGTTKMEVPKTEVGIDDLLSGGNYYADQMKQQFDEWKIANPNEEISEEEYQMAAINSRAFEYESIRDKQENKEFWVGIAALVVIIGVSLVCPPAGIALGAAYGVMEVSSAVSGEDWVSGREISTSERWIRGLLAPLDIIPAAGAVAKFAKGADLAHLGNHVGLTGIRTVGSQISSGAHQVQRLANSASQYATQRLRNAGQAVMDAKNAALNRVARDFVDAGKAVDQTVTWTRNNLNLGRQAITPDGTVFRIKETAENTHKAENTLKDFLSQFKGINLDSKTVINSNSNYKKFIRESFEGTGREAQDNFNRFHRENVWSDETLSNAEKVEIMRENFNRLTPEQKVDFNVIGDAKFLSRESDYTNWGDWPPINWPEFPGLDKAESIVSISRENPIPEKLDRIGSLYGNNFATVPDNGIKHTMDERAICYIDNPSAYHQYTFDSTYYIDCMDAIKNKDVDGLNKIIDDMNANNKELQIEYVDENDIMDWNLQYNRFQNNALLKALCEEKGLDSTYGLLGKAAPWYDEANNVLATGGAGQLNTPVSGNVLKYLGILREV